MKSYAKIPLKIFILVESTPKTLGKTLAFIQAMINSQDDDLHMEDEFSSNDGDGHPIDDADNADNSSVFESQFPGSRLVQSFTKILFYFRRQFCENQTILINF